MMEFLQNKIEESRQLINAIGYLMFHGFCYDGPTDERFLANSFSELIEYNYTRRVLVAERCGK